MTCFSYALHWHTPPGTDPNGPDVLLGKTDALGTEVEPTAAAEATAAGDAGTFKALLAVFKADVNPLLTCVKKSLKVLLIAL